MLEEFNIHYDQTLKLLIIGLGSYFCSQYIFCASFNRSALSQVPTMNNNIFFSFSREISSDIMICFHRVSLVYEQSHYYKYNQSHQKVWGYSRYKIRDSSGIRFEIASPAHQSLGTALFICKVIKLSPSLSTTILTAVTVLSVITLVPKKLVITFYFSSLRPKYHFE